MHLVIFQFELLELWLILRHGLEFEFEQVVQFSDKVIIAEIY